MSDTKLTHFNEQGRAQMVDVSHKEATKREATANALIRMKRETLEMILAGEMKKGDVLAVAQVAGVMAAKKTSDLIPMCHPLPISKVNITFRENLEEATLQVTATVATTYVTGVEMEALTAVTAAALTVYDMCKAVDKEMVITDVCLQEKKGGKSGDFFRKGSV
jgi:cyclic pyranopterin phosphate synthase